MHMRGFSIYLKIVSRTFKDRKVLYGLSSTADVEDLVQLNDDTAPDYDPDPN